MQAHGWMNYKRQFVFAVSALAITVWADDPVLLGAVWIVSAVAHVVFARRGLQIPATIWISVSLALTLWILQLVSGATNLRLLLKAACMILLLPLVFRSLPWARLGSSVLVTRKGLPVIFFLIFTRHFALILLDETRRAYTARRMSVPRSFSPGSFSSLTWATARVFERACVRAERFYAARVLDGFSE